MAKKIVTIVGARPQFIKAATLSRIFKNYSDIKEIIVHTGQHFDSNMSDIFFEELKIPKPHHFLDVHGGNHGQMTGRMMELIENVILKENPTSVLLYGDTNSTLAGALVAAKLHVPILHIEAGLRSFNKNMPEEINRVLTDHVSDLLFCPTKTSLENLKKEGITKGVHHVGDVMYDATLFSIEMIHKPEFRKNVLPMKFCFMTIHRSESTESFKKFQMIIDYAVEFSREKKLPIVFPVHPRTKKLIDEIPQRKKEIFLFKDPMSYMETQFCLSKASYVLTDSGGLQKESYFHHVPCVTLRSETEWVETIDSGWNRLWTCPNYQPRKEIIDYGYGKSAENILEIINKTM